MITKCGKNPEVLTHTYKNRLSGRLNMQGRRISWLSEASRRLFTGLQRECEDELRVRLIAFCDLCTARTREPREKMRTTMLFPKCNMLQMIYDRTPREIWLSSLLFLLGNIGNSQHPLPTEYLRYTTVEIQLLISRTKLWKGRLKIYMRYFESTDIYIEYKISC